MPDVPDYVGTNEHGVHDPVDLTLLNAGAERLGQVGVDPGTQWGSGNASTADNTLRRQSAICEGDTVTNDAFTPSTEWDGFATDTFFDPRDLVQVKYEMLRRVQSEGHSVTGAATAFGFSRPSFYQALSAFEEGGLAGLGFFGMVVRIPPGMQRNLVKLLLAISEGRTGCSLTMSMRGKQSVRSDSP